MVMIEFGPQNGLFADGPASFSLSFSLYLSPYLMYLGQCHAPVWSNSKTRQHRTILSRSTISNEEIMGGSWSAAVLQEIQ